MIRHAARAALLPLVAALDCAWRGASWAEVSCTRLQAKDAATLPVEDLPRALQQLPQLRELHLSSLQLGDRRFEDLCEVFMQGRLQWLERLYLAHNNLGTPGALALAQSLPKLPNLKVLNLPENAIRAPGAEALAKALAQGTPLLLGESHQEKCQYSHASWVRRNPCKVAYQPKLCTKENCPDKRLCRFAHSEEEVLYHPLTYKVHMCGVGCRGFYCPFAHGRHELRSPVEAEVQAQGAEDEDEDFLRFDDRLRINREDWESCARKPGLLRGELLEKRGSKNCLVRMAPYCRAQRSEAEQVVQDLREWIRNSDEGPIALRRSVATICVLWNPEVAGRQALDASPDARGVASCVELLRAVGIEQLRKLHDAGVAHCCLSPSNIFHFGAPQRFFLGDFVQKIRFLSLLHGHGKVDDDYESWALWQAPEVLERIQEGVRGRDKSVKALDYAAVDLWQLGAVAFYVLTGHHAFASRDNILAGQAVNRSLGEEKSPQLCKVLMQLMERKPEQRLALERLQDALKSLQLPLEGPPSPAQEAPPPNLTQEARAGALLRCIWPSGVRFHGDKLRLAQGDEIRVLERDGNWIRTAPGWLPLWGTRTMDYSPLFEVRQRAPPKPKPGPSPPSEESLQDLQGPQKNVPRRETQQEAKPQTVPVSVLDMALHQDVASLPELPAPPGLKLELPSQGGYAPPTTWTQFEWKPDDWKTFWQGFHVAAPDPSAARLSGPSSPASESSSTSVPAKVAFLVDMTNSPGPVTTAGPAGPPGLEKEGDFLWM